MAFSFQAVGKTPDSAMSFSRRGKQPTAREAGVARLILPATCLVLFVSALILASPHSRRALHDHAGQGSGVTGESVANGVGVGEPIEIRYENREIMELPRVTDTAVTAFQSELEQSAGMAEADGEGASESGGNSFLAAVEAMKAEGEEGEGGGQQSAGETGGDQGQGKSEAEGAGEVKAVLAEVTGDVESAAVSSGVAAGDASSGSEQQAGRGGESTATPEVQSPPDAPADSSPSASSSAPPSSVSSAARADLVERLRNLTAVLESIRPLAEERGNAQLVKHMRAVADKSRAVVARFESGGAWGGDEKATALVKLLEAVAARAKEWRSSAATIEKLRGEVERAKVKVAALTAERNQLDLAAAKALPKSLHCFNLRLTVEYGSNKDLRAVARRRERKQHALYADPSLRHYALFSDNVLAVATVLRSLEANTADAESHVVHVVTDAMNLPAMQAWFALHPPAKLALEISTVESFAFLNASYCPVLRQLQAKALKHFYFSQHDDAAQSGKAVHGAEGQGEAGTAAAAATADAAASSGQKQLKFKNPKYLSILNHLRFYLPEMYPSLDRIVFLDDDIVVQKDLTPLFELPLNGNVNGAVFTCREGSTFHRLHKYLNFSHPFIKEHFDSDGCGWAYGMNVFDLQQWRNKGLTDVYHKYQSMNSDRTLWQLGTLPPGLMTFYNLTAPLDPHWHVLGLGYDRSTDRRDIEQAAVLHYNGNSKPWLDTAMKEFKPLWSKYVLAEDDIVMQCNIDLN